MRAMVFSHEDAFLFEIDPALCFSMQRTEAVNGENSLSIATAQVLEKGQRILMKDETGTWREYVVASSDAVHEAGRNAVGTYFCVWSCKHDLSTVIVKDKRPSGGAEAALAAVLGETARWGVGEVGVTQEASASFYWVTAWDALQTISGKWGGEYRADIEVDGQSIVSRSISLVELGNEDARRFDFGEDMSSISRKVAENPVYCRVYPRGAGELTETGGYGRRVTIEEVNQGLAYLQDDAAAALVRLPDGMGGWEYPSVAITNQEISDPQELKDWGLAEMGKYTSPTVSYSATVAQYAEAGVDAQGVGIGDGVQVVDPTFYPDSALRLSARVVKLVTDELDPSRTQITIDNFAGSLASSLNAMGSQLSRVTSAVEEMNNGSLDTAEYVNSLIARINAAANATGGYTYIVPGQGILTYDVPVSDPSVGAEASQVVEVRGGTIRIADSKDSQGNWEWKTVFTSGHIAGEVVTAAQITTGYIGSAGGTFIDLDNNTIQLGETSLTHTVVKNDQTEWWQDADTLVGRIGQKDNVSIYYDGTGVWSSIYVAGSQVGSIGLAFTDIDFSAGPLTVVMRGSTAGTLEFTDYGTQTLDAAKVTLTQSSVRFACADGYQVMSCLAAVSFYHRTTAPTYQWGLASAPLTDVGGYSLLAGYNSKATGTAAAAFGNMTEAIANMAFAQGDSTTASGISSAAFGYHTGATGNYSVAEGYYSNATGKGAHVEGNYANATGDYSHSEGASTTASGSESHAEGSGTEASGLASHAQNTHTIAAGESQTALGKYNASDTTSALIIGNGTSDTSRSNALTVDWSGNVDAAGRVTGVGLTSNSTAQLNNAKADLTSGNIDVDDPSGSNIGAARLDFYDKDGEYFGTLAPFFEYGQIRLGFQARRTVNGTNYYSALRLGVDASGNATVALIGTGISAAFRAAMAAASLGANIFTGGEQELRSTNITNGTAPSAFTIGNARLMLRDKNGSGLGWVDVVAYPAKQSTRFYNTRTVNGSAKYNGFELGLDASGNPVDAFQDAASKTAFQNALGATSLVIKRSKIVSIPANTISLSVTADTVSGYTFLGWLQPASNGHVTAGYMQDPTLATTNLWMVGTRSSASSYRVTALYVKS